MTNRFRFDLFAVMEWTAGIAFLCALLAGAGSRASWTSDFTNLPEEDAALLAWLAAHGEEDVQVTREGNSITLATESGVFGNSGFGEGVANPPWDELGYRGLQGKRGSFQWRMFSGSPYLWVTGFCVLIALGLIRRRYVKPSGDVQEEEAL